MTHHDKITAKRPPNNGEGDSGSFDIVENDGVFSVYEGGYCHASDCGSLDEAAKTAEKLAATFDAVALANLKTQWRNDPSFDIEDAVGFEDCRQELYTFRLETELAAVRKEIQRLHSIVRPFGQLLNELCGLNR